MPIMDQLASSVARLLAAASTPSSFLASARELTAAQLTAVAGAAFLLFLIASRTFTAFLDNVLFPAHKILGPTLAESSSGSPRPKHFDASDHILLVIAHPDDECMFFGPTVVALARGHRALVHVLSLSTGNADGLGAVRVKELVRSCAVLGVPEARVHWVDAPQLQDGMRNVWSAREIRRHVRETVQAHGITQIITFDERGVSGHPNHIAVASALLAWTATPVWQLRSVPLVHKYAGLAVPRRLLRALSATQGPGRLVIGDGVGVGQDQWVVVARDAQAHRVQLAMQCHATQLVWFRWLYVRCAYYMWANVLERVPAADEDEEVVEEQGADREMRTRRRAPAAAAARRARGSRIE
ncbi:N-acetylglucosaminyl-phosphatidylinositol de-N-acetylase [Allomyces arbusculus]|nr:N-acetylglucosaminyl-phosphatidylinositol de-N-acetylase [Allomyces arbusculus]